MALSFRSSRLVASTALAALCCLTGAASATTVTFGTATPGANVSSYSEAGYNFTGTGGGGQIYHGRSDYCGGGCADNGTPWMAAFPDASTADANTIVMKAADNSLFSLVSFDGAEAPFSGVSNFWFAAAITVTGVLADNSTVSQDFTLDQINDGAGGVADFQAFGGLSGAFKELRFSGVLGNGRSFAIDNVNVGAANNVPEPTSLALVALALLGLGARSRYAKAAGR